jgi:MORN repeat
LRAQEGVKKPELPPFAWRVAALGLLDKADDEDSYGESEAKRAAAYEGPFNIKGRREGSCTRAVYANNDCYIGEYADDMRHGVGMYIFANKGAYAGAVNRRAHLCYDCLP